MAAHNPLRKFFASRAWPTNLTLQAKSSIYWTEWGAARRQKRGVSSGHRFTGESSPSYREKTSQRAPKKMNENAIRESPHKLTSDTSSHWVVLFQSISPNIWLECDPFSWWKGMYTFEGTNISRHGKRKIIFKNAMVGDMLVPRMIIFCLPFKIGVLHFPTASRKSWKTCGPLKDPRSPKPWEEVNTVAAEDALKWSRV